MNAFNAKSMRLKLELGVTTDRDLAAALGFSPRAWAGRKKSQEFPETQLWALKARHPELRIDVKYVLTGQRMGTTAASECDGDTGALEILAALTEGAMGELVNGIASQYPLDQQFADLAKAADALSDEDRDVFWFVLGVHARDILRSKGVLA